MPFTWFADFYADVDDSGGKVFAFAIDTFSGGREDFGDHTILDPNSPEGFCSSLGVNDAGVG
jgi:hypothetical protein